MKVLNPGERSVLVQYVQLALNRAGYDIRKDGILGENTCRALRQFLRKKSGEEFNCKIDDIVWGKLFPYLKGYTMHEIKSGDTLWGIAANYDTSVSAIMTANPTVNPLALRTGSILAIPFSFSLVAEDVAYTSYLNDWILEGLTVRYPFLVQGNIGKVRWERKFPIFGLEQESGKSFTVEHIMPTNGLPHRSCLNLRKNMPMHLQRDACFIRCRQRGFLWIFPVSCSPGKPGWRGFSEWSIRRGCILRRGRAHCS